MFRPVPPFLCKGQIKQWFVSSVFFVFCEGAGCGGGGGGGGRLG